MEVFDKKSNQSFDFPDDASKEEIDSFFAQREGTAPAAPAAPSTLERWGPTAIRLSPLLAAPFGPLATGPLSAAAEYAAEKAEGRPVNLRQVLTQGLLGTVPGLRTPEAITSTLGKVAFRAAEGFGFGGAATQASQLAETGEFAGPKQTLIGGGVGALLGGGLGGGSEVLGARRAATGRAKVEDILLRNGLGPPVTPVLDPALAGRLEGAETAREASLQGTVAEQQAAQVAEQHRQVALAGRLDAAEYNRTRSLAETEAEQQAAQREGRVSRAALAARLEGDEAGREVSLQQAVAEQQVPVSTTVPLDPEHQAFVLRQQEEAAAQAEARRAAMAIPPDPNAAALAAEQADYLARGQAAAMRQALYSDMSTQIGPPQPEAGPRSIAEALAKATKEQRKPFLTSAKEIAQAPVPVVEPPLTTSSLLEQASETLRGKPAVPESPTSQLLREASETLNTPGTRNAAAIMYNLARDQKGSTLLFGDVADAARRGSRVARNLWAYAKVAAHDLSGTSYKRDIPPEYMEEFSNAWVEGKAVSDPHIVELEQVAAVLTPAERQYVLEHGAEVSRGREAMAPGLRGAEAFLQVWKTARETLHAAALATGEQVGEIENYFPQEPTKAAIRAIQAKRGPVWEAIKRELGPLDVDLDNLHTLFSSDVTTRAFGNFKERKLINLPATIAVQDGDRLYTVALTNNNPFDVLPRYIRDAGRKIGISKVLGPGAQATERVKDMIAEMRQAGPQGEAAARVMEPAYNNLNGVPYTDWTAQVLHNGFIGGMNDLARGVLIPGSVIDNWTSGFWPASARYGFLKTMSATGRILLDSLSGGRLTGTATAESRAQPQRRAAAMRKGILENLTYGFEPLSAQNVPGTLRQAVRRASGLPSEATGLAWVNVEINKTSAVLGKEYMASALLKAKAGNPTELLDMSKWMHVQEDELARWLHDGFNDTDYLRFMKMGPARFNLYDEMPLDYRRWTQHPGAREVFAFANWTRAMGTLTYDLFKHAVTTGDFKPFALLHGGLFIGNYAADAAKDWLKGKTDAGELNWHHVADAWLRTGLLGLWGRYGSEAVRASQDPRMASAPISTTLSHLASQTPLARQLDHFYQILSSDRKEEGLRRAVPIYDMVAHSVFGEPSLEQLATQHRASRQGGAGGFGTGAGTPRQPSAGGFGR